MAKSRAVMIRGAVGAVLMVAAFGCGGAQHPAVEQQAAATEAVPEPAIGPPPECVDEHDRQVTCLSDSDCCPGFSCGKDPERNPRESFCLYGG
ncbi:MAG TPA: hypothetical protein VNN80_01825 [Polyangiaceae bacterium]|nr:hypothetical protein [Polyangiaceae bacterium]